MVPKPLPGLVPPYIESPCQVSSGWLNKQPELTWHGDSTYGGTKPGWGWGTISRRNRHAKLAPAGSINMGASPLCNLVSLLVTILFPVFAFYKGSENDKKGRRRDLV